MDNVQGMLFNFHVLVIFLTMAACYTISRTYLRRRKQNLGKSHQLPPGSMGLPFFGETLQLYSQDPNLFLSTRQNRYGEIFKSHILGCPCVMLAGPEAARFVLVKQAHLFKPTYPKSKENLIGPRALFFHQGEYHARLRKLVQGSLYPASIRCIVADIESLTLAALNSWADDEGPINTYRKMKQLSFEVGVLAIFGHLEPRYRDELKRNYAIVDSGYNSFPVNFPGSRYGDATKARRRLSEILNAIAGERREKRLTEKNLISCFLNYKDEEGKTLSDDEIADNIIGVLFAAQDTTASAMTWTVKYLHDNPKVLEAVKDEQKRIYCSNGNGRSHLTWHQTRDEEMPLTNKVVLESLRLATIISFTFREAVADIEYKGYLIPKGWKVMPLFRSIHHNPDLFKDPLDFDPSRFEDIIKPPYTFMPFGSGSHGCPGNELAKLEILVLLHLLMSRYRYEVVESERGVQYSPFPVPLHGLPARFFKEE